MSLQNNFDDDPLINSFICEHILNLSFELSEDYPLEPSFKFVIPDLTPYLDFLEDTLDDFTGISFSRTLTVLIMAIFVKEEAEFLMSNGTVPQSKSFIEHGTISGTTVYLNMFLLVSAICGVLSTILLFLAICYEKQYLLLPWLLTMSVIMLLEFVYYGYMLVVKTINYTPIAAYLFALDFFILVSHIYSFLCIISLYQEFNLKREIKRQNNYSGQKKNSIAGKHNTLSDSNTTNTHSSPLPEISVCLPEKYSFMLMERPNNSIKKGKKVQFPNDEVIEKVKVQDT